MTESQTINGKVRYAHDGENLLVDDEYIDLTAKSEAALDRFDVHLEAVRQEFIRKDRRISNQSALIYFLLTWVLILTGLLIYITV